MTPGAPTDIFLIDVNGARLRNLTATPDIWEYLPSWSPNGRELVFMSKMAIYVLDLETGERRRISPESSCDTYPSWSPDGRKILFESILPGSNADIYICDVDGRNRTRLTKHPLPDQQPTFTPDGRYVVFVSRRDGPYNLFVLNLIDGRVKRLPVGDKMVATWNPAVSPDGRMIAFKGKEASDPMGSWWIYVMDFPSGGKLRRLAKGGSPCWSPIPYMGLNPSSKILTLWGILKIGFKSGDHLGN
jgi:Tol biopolymer transport system component